MIQDILVFGIILAAGTRTLIAIVKFFRPVKDKNKVYCSGCTECAHQPSNLKPNKLFIG